MKRLRSTGLTGIEPMAYRLGGGRSILLSYSPIEELDPHIYHSKKSEGQAIVRYRCMSD